MSTDNDFPSLPLTLDLHPEPLPVLQLGVGRFVQPVESSVVDSVGPVGVAQTPLPISWHLGTTLEMEER